MMNLVLVASLGGALVCGPAVAGVHPPEVEARLATFAHDWTIEGLAGGYRETCEWYHGRAFVVCNTTELEDGKTRHSVSILGWSSQSRTYTYHHYSDAGSSRSETGYPTDTGGIVFLGERVTQAGFAQYRSVITPVAGAVGFTFEQHRSFNGGPWQPTATFRYVPWRRVQTP